MREQKITLGEMRGSGVHGPLVYCSDYRCSHLVKFGPADVDRWSEGVRLSDLEPKFRCMRCGRAVQISVQISDRRKWAPRHEVTLKPAIDILS